MKGDKRSLLLEVKSFDSSGNGYLEGYGAVKGNIDSYGDVITDGAFKNLDKFIGSGFMAEGHDWKSAIGWVEDAREDSKGLWVKLAFHSTPDAQMVRTKAQERVDAGRSVGLSIGFFTTAYSDAERDGVKVRELREVEVYEVSVVTVPANSQATATSVKSGTGVPREEQLETLQGGVSDYLSRIADLAEKRGDDWKAQRAIELRSLASDLAETADLIEPAPTTPEPNPEADAILAKALKLVG